MIQRVSVTAVLRACLALALTLSWLLLAGTPAHAFVTNSYVEKPAAGAVLAERSPLVVVVERSAPPADPENESISVLSDLFYVPPPAAPEPGPSEGPPGAPVGEEQQAQPEPQRLNKKPIPLPFKNSRMDGPREVRRFGLPIDPYALVWQRGGGVARNGHYLLRYRTVSQIGDNEPRGQDWPQIEFRIDAPPAAQAAPAVETADAAAKRMTITWAANAAPDITSYKVERRRDGGDWETAQEGVAPDVTSIDDTVAKYGAYRYRVTAYRPAGDGSGKLRATRSGASGDHDLQPPEDEAPRGPGADGDTTSGGDDGDGDGTTGTGTGTGTGGSDTSQPPSLPNSSGSSSTSGFGTTTTEPFSPSVSAPRGFDDTYRGPLDFGVEPETVTERVPVDIAQGGAAGEDSTLQILDRAIDQERVLPPLAGGLILVISAAHVLRYLNE